MVRLANEIKKDFPKSNYMNEIKELNPHAWAKEGLHISNSFVYRNIEEDKSPSNTYVTEGQKVAKGKIALAGYRLAEMIKEIAKAQAMPMSDDE